MTDWARQIRISRAEITLLPERGWQLPPMPEVMLRGALGLAMMDIACLRNHRDCRRCDATKGCPIPTWFDPGRLGSDLHRPVFIRVPRWGGRVLSPEQPLVIEMWLLDDLPRVSLLVEALVRMGRVGLGQDRISHHLARLRVDGLHTTVDVVVDEQQVAPWPGSGTLQQFLPSMPHLARLPVVLRTPFCHRDASPHRPPVPGLLLKAGLDRLRRIAQAQGEELQRWWPPPEEVVGCWEEARWIDSSRYSRRQEASLDLSGWQGTLHFQGDVADLLAAMTVVGAGRNISAGCGQLSFLLPT